VLRVVAGRVRDAAKVEWGARKIGAACNALASKSVESGVPRRVAPRLYGKTRPERPSRRGTVFILRSAGPKVEARRAEAKFWARKIGAVCNALANKSVESAVSRRVAPRSYGKARPEGPSRRATVFMLRPAKPKVEARRAEAKLGCG